MRTSGLTRRYLLAGAGVGVVVGAAALCVAWEHNPQGEFHDELGVRWPACVSLIGSYCLMGVGAGILMRAWAWLLAFVR